MFETKGRKGSTYIESISRSCQEIDGQGLLSSRSRLQNLHARRPLSVNSFEAHAEDNSPTCNDGTKMLNDIGVHFPQALSCARDFTAPPAILLTIPDIVPMLFSLLLPPPHCGLNDSTTLWGRPAQPTLAGVSQFNLDVT